MWLRDGEYSFELHHLSHRAVGVPGTVAGLRLAWEQQGSLPWERLVRPAVELAEEGFEVTHGLAASLARVLDRMGRYPASVAQFSKDGVPYEAGEILRQPDLAASLERILENGVAGFYEGRTAELLVAEMEAGDGLITHEDLKAYRAVVREPIRSTYRGVEIISMPPPSSGGTVLALMLNILEGYDLAENGFGSAQNLHLMAEAMRRAYADRALHLGDPDLQPGDPIAPPDLEELRGGAPRDDPGRERLGLLADELRVGRRERRDDALLGSRPGTERRLAHLHPGVRLRLGHRGAGRRVPAEQRDGGLQRSAGPHR